MKAPAVVFVEPRRMEIREMTLPEVARRRSASRPSTRASVRAPSGGRSPAATTTSTRTWPSTTRARPATRRRGSWTSSGRGRSLRGRPTTRSRWGRTSTTRTTSTRGRCRPRTRDTSSSTPRRAWKVAPEVDLAGVSLFHMAGVSRSGVRITKIQPDDLVALIGSHDRTDVGQPHSGPARGSSPPTHPERCEAAAKYSADRVVDGTTQTSRTRCARRSRRRRRRDRHDGHQRDVRPLPGPRPARGQDHDAGVLRRPDRDRLPPHASHAGERDVPCGWDDEFNDELASDMASGGIAIDPLITHKIPYTDAAEAYEMVLEHPERSLGMVLDWAGV